MKLFDYFNAALIEPGTYTVKNPCGNSPPVTYIIKKQLTLHLHEGIPIISPYDLWKAERRVACHYPSKHNKKHIVKSTMAMFHHWELQQMPHRLTHETI